MRSFAESLFCLNYKFCSEIEYDLVSIREFRKELFLRKM